MYKYLYYLQNAGGLVLLLNKYEFTIFNILAQLFWSLFKYLRYRNVDSLEFSKQSTLQDSHCSNLNLELPFIFLLSIS